MAERLSQLIHVAIERAPVVGPDPGRDVELLWPNDGVETVRGECQGDEPLVVHLGVPCVGRGGVSGLDEMGTPLEELKYILTLNLAQTVQGVLPQLHLAHLSHHIEGISRLNQDVLGNLGARWMSDAELSEGFEVVALELIPSWFNDLAQPDLDRSPAIEADELANRGTPERSHGIKGVRKRSG